MQGDKLIAVLPHARFKALEDLANSPDEETGAVARPVTVVPAWEAFERRWETDAHFVGYFPEPYDPSEPFFRLQKHVLKEIRSRSLYKTPQGEERRPDVVLNFVGLDWDTGKGPNHLPWVPDSWRRFQDLLADAEKDEVFSRIVRSAFASYSTAKGYRWVFSLDPPLPVDLAEVKIRGLIDVFWSQGLKVDRQCADWTRLFRLPRVRRLHEE